MIGQNKRASLAAGSWIGTPYHHQASVKQVGCDCLGLLRGVYREIVGPEPHTIPNYSPAWDEVERREEMLLVCRKFLVPMPVTQREEGNVLIFRMQRTAVAKHCGIVVTSGRFIHSHSGRGTVNIELSDYWNARVVGVFAFPEKI